MSECFIKLTKAIKVVINVSMINIYMYFLFHHFIYLFIFSFLKCLDFAIIY